MVDANRLGNIASTLAGPSASVGTLAQRAAQRAQQSSVPPNPGSQGQTGGDAHGAGGGNGASGSPGSAGTGPGGGTAAGAGGVGGGGGGGHGGVLATIGAGFAWMLSVEKLLSTPFGMIPFPGFPALRVFDMDVGLPHAHNHPPNLIPPNPVPIPLPSMGPVIPIPIVSGASKTFIEKMPAARCGDMGLGIWCGGFFPMFEVFLGSANVWTEGARQARLLVDITKHCIFTSPKPSDPPMGPMVGTTISGAGTVFVGGIPMPSLMSMALGALFKGLFKGLGAVFNRIRARVTVWRFLRNGAIHGDEAFRRAAMNDLLMIARTRTGRELLNDISRSGQRVEIFQHTHPTVAADFNKAGPHCKPNDAINSLAQVAHDPAGAHMVQVWDPHTGRWVEAPGNITGRGTGSGSHIAYDPAQFPNAAHPGSPSDVVLAHELNHSRNMANGNNRQLVRSSDPTWNRDWTNREEAATVGVENSYRAERGGVPQRNNYRHLP
jgi:Effector protein